MGERMERFSTFPFSVSCVSQSSVDVFVTGHLRRSRVVRTPSAPAVEDAGERDAKVIAGANISAGIQKAVMKGIKSISQLFFERTEEEDEGMMEIGYPTDVQHVAHVGPDGSSAACSFTNTAALFCLPPISLTQFQHSMNNS